MTTIITTRPAWTVKEIILLAVGALLLGLGGFFLLGRLGQQLKGVDSGREVLARSVARATQQFYQDYQLYPWNLPNQKYLPVITAPEPIFLSQPAWGDSLHWLENLYLAGYLTAAEVTKLRGQPDFTWFKPQGAQSQIWVCFTPQASVYQEAATHACAGNRANLPSAYRTFIPCPSSGEKLYCLTGS